jgi:hypothetical protein
MQKLSQLEVEVHSSRKLQVSSESSWLAVRNLNCQQLVMKE